MNLPVQDEPLPKRPAPQSKSGINLIGQEVVSRPRHVLGGAPTPLAEWVGREDLLEALNEDWLGLQRFVTGLIGFGGEGKSSLARRWVDNLLQDPSLPQPDGVFWWGFYEKNNVDEFFEAALTFIVGGIDPRQLPSTKMKAQVIQAMLGGGRYLFILDGLEVLQHQDGDDYGLLFNNDLREFLSYIAAGEHKSFCLINSRAPLLDLIEYTTYSHRDLDRLSAKEGRALLQKVGVKGSDAALDRVVADWDGYALVLSLLGTYLADLYEGDVKHIDDIPPPTTDEPRYERVRRVLRQYDKHLTEAERAFLMIFSVLRLPVQESAFAQVFRTEMDTDDLNRALVVLDDAAFSAMVKRLLNYRILRHNSETGYYTTHPLIRAYYLTLLRADNPIQFQAVHSKIAYYYLSTATCIPYNSTLDELAPLIEAVHHACQSGANDEAYLIWRERIDKAERFVLLNQLGAYETALRMAMEFFPKGDISQEPQVKDITSKRIILNIVGFCLKSLGRLSEAIPFYERGNTLEMIEEDWRNASITCYNLAELHGYRGELNVSANAAKKALYFAGIAQNLDATIFALSRQAWIASQRGEVEAADEGFRQAERLERINTQHRYLFGLRGVLHAEHLYRTGNVTYARKITQANIVGCEAKGLVSLISKCHLVLGNLNAHVMQHDDAQKHYNEAVKIARSISERSVLIEALLARGRWAARYGEVEAASDLDEALNYALAGGYGIYAADVRVALAWMHQSASKPSAARAEAEQAKRMSAEMGYHWGQVDAAEVLAALG
jgi:tetratricopeptide (TPR) repeat protein